MANIDDLTHDELMRQPEPGDFVLAFGKYHGRTLDQIANTDRGLLYLD